MFALNDKVLDRAGKVFSIAEIRPMDFGNGNEDYFILKPCFPYDFSSGYQCFVPISKADQLLKKVMNREEALKLIDDYSSLDVLVAHNPREKKLFFQQILSAGERVDVLKVYKTLRYSREERLKKNKPFSDFDSRLLKNLNNLFISELSIALNIPVTSVPAFVSERLGEAIFES